ncbi:CynX/NimT family MFS transporter [Pseudonocardia eucalypti]|uniref:CynX/NimT family MFS transporter n=1 Tax=Pseudonocardia eucalypti TaxID=648755 RepID=A0ABP9R1U5_9PSEU|nr:CP family cyanate transporter-like MFS transporter [Pseudonocardia eucalypti]
MPESMAIAPIRPRRVTRSIGRFTGPTLVQTSDPKPARPGPPPSAAPGSPTPAAAASDSASDRAEAAGSAPVRPEGAEPAPGRRVLVVVGIALVAVNLRTAVTSLGALLGEVTAAWSFSGAAAGLLTALPVLTFALLGVGAPRLARRLGTETLVALAMLFTAGGLAMRAVTGAWPVFLLASVLALAGAAVGNVLLPPLVKKYFPDRIGALTALYTTALALGMTGGAALTVPTQRALDGDWRVGLGIWAGLALVAVPPWLALATGAGAVEPGPARRMAVHRSGTALALTVFFGCQSCNAYVVLDWLPTVLADAGVDPARAGIPLAVFGAAAVPASLLVPWLAARSDGAQRGLVLATALSYAAGYLGLLGAPAGAGWLWGLLLGVGNGAFPLAVTLIGLRSHDAEVTAALSGLVQGAGYLLAAAGPLLVGLLHQSTGGWRAPLLVLLGGLVVQLASGLRAARSGTVDGFSNQH